eukprot:Nk52_evm4s454 gene=Nk52_evmTU4s454
MLADPSRRNRNFSVPCSCSVAASITLSIALLVVLLVSPARAVFEFKRINSTEVQCIVYGDSTCSKDILHQASLELGKCYQVEVGLTQSIEQSRGTRYFQVDSIDSEKFSYIICGDDSCTKCTKMYNFYNVGKCSRFEYESPLCRAKPAK